MGSVVIDIVNYIINNKIVRGAGVLFTAVAMVSTYYTTYKQLKNKGYSDDKANLYSWGAALVVTAAGALGNLLLPGIGGILLAGIAEGAIYTAINPPKKHPKTVTQPSYQTGSVKPGTTVKYPKHPKKQPKKDGLTKLVKGITKWFKKAAKKLERKQNSKKRITQSTYQTGSVAPGTSVKNKNHKSKKKGKK